MTFPNVSTVDTAFTAASSQASPLAISAPSNTQNGDLLLGFLNRAGSSVQTFAWPAGWTETTSGVPTSTVAGRYSLAFRISTGGDSSAMSVTVTGATAAQPTAAIVIRIQQWYGTSASFAWALKTSTAASVNPDPPSLTPSWPQGDNLWLAVVIVAAGGLGGIPSSYANFANTVTPTISLAKRNLNAASEDPGAWTIVTSQNWQAHTFAIRQSIPWIDATWPVGQTFRRAVGY